MTYKIEKEDYQRVLPLIKSQNELSVFAVLQGMLPGEVYVNHVQNPTAVFIRTSECNYVAGGTEDQEFNKFIGEVLDFWDPVTPDTEQWYDVIPRFHKDRFIRRYTRHHYLLEHSSYQDKQLSISEGNMQDQSTSPCTRPLIPDGYALKHVEPLIPDGYVLEHVEPGKLRNCDYKNADELLDWMENWGDDEAFQKYGAGTYLRKENVIVSWSLSDCAAEDHIAIGIHTDEAYRKQGFAKIVAAETIRECFRKGYRTIEWLCVDFNAGSNALAAGLGFQLQNTYSSFTPYAPVENMTDLSEKEWEEWAEYFEEAAEEEPNLQEECIYTYVKTNNPEKFGELLTKYDKSETMKEQMDGFVSYLQTKGMASRFKRITV